MDIPLMYGEMFCNSFPAAMRNNSKVYPYYCNESGFSWDVTNETIKHKKMLKDTAINGLTKL